MKLSSAVSSIANGLRSRRFPMVLVALYAAIWIRAAWAPVYRFDWLLESMLPTVMALVLVASFRRLPLSILILAPTKQAFRARTIAEPHASLQRKLLRY